MSRILVVDDEQSMRDMLGIALGAQGHDIVTAPNGQAAQAELRSGRVDVVVSDIRMPGLDGIELLRYVKDESPETEVILITAYASTDSAIEALRLGAYDYVTKPFDIEELKVTVGHALEQRELRRENVLLKRELDERYRFDQLVGRSDPMRRVFDFIERVADSDTTVLICGESGTGKELVARAIHSRSPREERPFVTVNCAALPAQLLESELFGHVKGSFTGADRNKEGLFESAEGGTLLLDEIGDMPLSMQPKLLRVLEDHKVRRVGSTKETPIDVRVLAATNKDLEAAVEAGDFREDLFYRTNVIQVELPPLRERKEDIRLLVEHFLERYAREAGKRVQTVDPEALAALEAYHWPGNVRELANAVRHAVTLEVDEAIRPGSLPLSVQRHAADDAVPGVEGDGSAASDGAAPAADASAAGASAAAPADASAAPADASAAAGASSGAGGQVAAGPSGELPGSGLDLESHLDEVKREYMLRALEQAGGVQKKAAELLGMSFRSFRYYLDKFDLRDQLD